ncbi:hypothetical protein PC129_g21432 [Phytophthora cactorum]|uniref:Uncharacterized protein n=1 Tax=Phytophthora cactorum TaxID=29920 RepID=A0A329RKY7_9STRA|nr:hypothetical protein PC111_g15780 [Phytophthora cactorum]KAG2824048.1 hypothetical protein PC113_g22092 [Phytophthora cactorum]KAG2875425.1 hypothetical protein PC114_g24734 [Phytophthora cactorum]KAG2882212.1 hypothetical protein PC115_g22006 [Phytophthora cactorum]KAG2890003.1 hypothetical protein PC117_g24570 [Phytophthora cactorum]
MLAEKLSLTVQALAHLENDTMGLIDKQWLATIKARVCPEKLEKKYTIIRIDNGEVLIHYHEVFINWPCAVCYSNDHPSKYCRAAQDTFAGVKALRTLAITGRLPSKNAERKCTYAAAATTWTLNRLQDALTSQRLGSVKTGKTGSPYGTTQTSATTPVGDTSRNMGDSSPSLPGEWEQHRPMRKVSKATKPGDSELMTGTTSLPVVGTRPCHDARKTRNQNQRTGIVPS